MKKIKYVVGDATAPVANGDKVIIHCCNNIGAWGAGFVIALSKKWPQPEKAYLSWASRCHPNTMPLGAIQPVEVESDTYVFNIIGQHKTFFSADGISPIRYEAIREGLRQTRAHVSVLNNGSIHMPRMGAGLAGGDWEVIAKIVQEELVDHGIPVTVYDLEPEIPSNQKPNLL